MRAKGAQRDTAQGMPMKAVRMVAAVAVVMKKVLAIQRAKKMCERSQVRRRVSHGIWRREMRCLRWA